MSKIRVFELAKQLGISSKELMAKLQELGFAITSHMSTLEDKEAKLVLKKLGHLKREKKVETKKARPKKKEKKEEPKKEKPVKAPKEKPKKKKKKEPAKKEEKAEKPPSAAAVAEPPEAVVEPPKVEVAEPPEKAVEEAVEKPPSPPAEAQPEPDESAEDETALLLEEKRRIEWRTRRRDRRKRRREREKERLKKLEETKAADAPPPSERLLRRKARGPRKPVIAVDEVITVDELAKQLKMKAGALILELMQMNIMATKNQPLEPDVVRQVADKHGYEVQVATSLEDTLIEEEEAEEVPEKLQPRAPVVTVMGHVDHGKTALLDVIRQTNVMQEEAGGITQHIGAYDVRLDSGHVVFLDTPGHEAFTAMRAHGAHVTDVVVLVVAADDGVMPQTVEALNHARAAGVAVVVAINKIDKAEAKVERVKQQLANLDLVPEDWGGKTITVQVSAKTKQGINELLEMLLLEAELLELRANPQKPARGIVLEAKLDKGRGPVATVLVQEGTLRIGDVFVAGTQHGKVRALLNDLGKNIEQAGPSTPVEVLGFQGVAQAGDTFISLDDEKKARQIADSRALKQRQKEMMRQKRVTLEDLYEQILTGEIKELNIIIKGDVQGSVTALQDSLLKLPTENVKLNVIHAGVGGINESDVILASASNALLLGFNVRPDVKARDLAEKEGVDYRLYRVIYDVIDDVRASMEGLLEPERKEVFVGRAEVIQTFKVSAVGTVAGSRVTEGEIEQGQRIRLIRDGIIAHEGKVSSVKRYKDFVQTARAGTECGISLENFNDIKVGDVLECYRVEEVARKL